LYHEKQDAGLCGVHALNNLLQGPYFSEVDLMQIAQRLDAQEKSLMAEQGMETTDFIKFVAEDSGNVAVDGNFSVNVLKEALSTFNIVCIPITHPDMKLSAENPLSENAFLCNLHSHWFAIRKIENDYWDLNSLHKRPNYLGELYLGAFLKQLQVDNYSIFVVRGEFPRIIRGQSDPNWIVVNRKSNYRARSEEEEFSAAIAASLGQTSSNIRQFQENDLQSAIEESLQTSEDKDLEAALLLSMDTKSATENSKKKTKNTLPTEPDDGAPNTTRIVVRLPSGSKAERRFEINNYLEDIFTWLDIAYNIDFSSGKYSLVNSLPRREYSDKEKSLSELGLVGSVVLTVTCK